MRPIDEEFVESLASYINIMKRENIDSISVSYSDTIDLEAVLKKIEKKYPLFKFEKDTCQRIKTSKKDVFEVLDSFFEVYPEAVITFQGKKKKDFLKTIEKIEEKGFETLLITEEDQTELRVGK